jgi:hypothetical protein
MASIGQVGSQGVLPFFNDAVAATVVQIKGAQGQLYGFKLLNTTAAVAYLQVFSLPSASVTLGVTVADFDIRLAANENVLIPWPMGLGFSGGGSGISLAGTTTAGGAVGAAISVTAFFL